MTLASFRKVSQATALLACTAALFRLRHDPHALAWLARMSPLSAMTTRIAAREWTASFWPAALFAFLGLLLPRFFCGWVCPVGTMIDLAGRWWVRPPRAVMPRRARGGGLAVLLALVAVAFTSYDLASRFDPMSLLAATATPRLASERDAVVHLLSGGARGTLWGRRQLDHQAAAIGLMTLLFAVGLTARAPRAWCRSVCPLGALYGVLGKRALFYRRRGRECTRCGACAAACGMGCLFADGSLARPDLCVSCGRCSALCPRGAVRFAPRAGPGGADPVPRGSLAPAGRLTRSRCALPKRTGGRSLR